MQGNLPLLWEEILSLFSKIVHYTNSLKKISEQRADGVSLARQKCDEPMEIIFQHTLFLRAVNITGHAYDCHTYSATNLGTQRDFFRDHL